MASKRANGEGSVYRLADGTWRASITADNGCRIIRKPQAQTRRAADQLLRKLLREREEGALTSGSMTFGQFVPLWLEAVRARNARPRTLESYQEKMAKHVVPDLGRLRLDKLTSTDIERLYAKKLQAGLAPKTIEVIHSALFNLLKHAKRKKLVGQNVAEHIDRPKVEPYAARPLTIEEARLLLRSIRGHRHEAFWTFLLGSGCRFGEAAGLTWANVDLESRLATIAQAATRHKTNKGYRLDLSPTKTTAGRRQVPLPSWVTEALRAQRDRVAEMRLLAGAGWEDLDLVFPNTRGRLLRQAHVNDAWHAMQRAVGLPENRMHDLRHTKATLMMDEGEELAVVQRTLGHANSSITASIYVGRVPKALRRAAERYGELLDPRNEVSG